MPADFIGSVMNRRKKVVVKSTETPRLPRHGVEEIRDIYDLWVSYAHEVGDKEGKLDRNALIEILAGNFASMIGCLFVAYSNKTLSSPYHSGSVKLLQWCLMEQHLGLMLLNL